MKPPSHLNLSLALVSLRLSLFGFIPLLTSCVDTSSINRTVAPLDRHITFLLVDNSLSYNNPDDETSLRVMKMVREEILGRMRDAGPGDHLIVRTIQSDSNQLSAILSNLNLAKDLFHFGKPRPTNPIELKVWEGEKRVFEDTLQDEINPLVERAVGEFEENASRVFASPSRQTDFVGALLSCQRFFEKRNYQSRRMIIYSDMIEDAALEDESLIDLTGVTVEARFVTRPVGDGPGDTHLYFKALEAHWREKLNADEFELYEVQNSF